MSVEVAAHRVVGGLHAVEGTPVMGTQAVVWGTLVAELGKLVAWGIHLQSYSYLKWKMEHIIKQTCITHIPSRASPTSRWAGAATPV